MTLEWSAPESANLGDIIAVAVGAVIWVDIETFGNAKLVWFETFLELPNGIPSRDTFGRVFAIIDARNFQDLFTEWTKRVWEAAEEQGADYVLAVKKNHPQLWDDIVGGFKYGERTRFASIEHDVFETVNKGHGRVERRRRLGDVRPVRSRTRERPGRVGEHERRGDDRIRAAGGRRDFGSQSALHNESAG